MLRVGWARWHYCDAPLQSYLPILPAAEENPKSEKGNVITGSEEILKKKKCNHRTRRNIGVNTMMRRRYPDRHGQSSPDHSASQ